MIESIDEVPCLPVRRADSHKGDYGRVLIVAGSRGMTGAAALAGMGALRSGAGLVFLALPASCWSVVAALEPGYLTVPLAEDEKGRLAAGALAELNQRVENADVAAIGPGLGVTEDIRQIVTEIYRSWKLPLVVDADALNALAHHRDMLGDHAGPRIFTPHPGEFRRLLGGESSGDEEAINFARTHDVVMVLKGHRTLVTDGQRLYRNTTGNAGMATGGSGDVLTGVVAALLGQGMTPFDAACLGVWAHGRAGDVMVSERGQMALVARDLIDGLPRVWRELEADGKGAQGPIGRRGRTV